MSITQFAQSSSSLLVPDVSGIRSSVSPARTLGRASSSRRPSMQQSIGAGVRLRVPQEYRLTAPVRGRARRRRPPSPPSLRATTAPLTAPPPRVPRR
jgi:hypothetical protein